MAIKQTMRMWVDWQAAAQDISDVSRHIGNMEPNKQDAIARILREACEGDAQFQEQMANLYNLLDDTKDAWA